MECTYYSYKEESLVSPALKWDLKVCIMKVVYVVFYTKFCKNCTKDNRAKSSTYMNIGKNEARNKKP